MIPEIAPREVTTAGALSSVAFGIAEADASHVMRILRDTLYSDKIMAVLREYTSNAWDANREMGRGDQPIKVLLPTALEPSLSIRDHGPGLSRLAVQSIYSQYGASTKRGSNAAVGMLGIGSKSGFAYSDSFTVVSWHGGVRSTYVAVIDESERGRIDLLHEELCDEAETGVEIQLAVRPQDIPLFEARAKVLFAHFSPRPEINLELPKLEGREIPGLGKVIERPTTGNHYDWGGKWIAVMGCVPYSIDLSQLASSIPVLSASARNVNGILPFDIGELQVAASREGLKYGDSTKVALVTRINKIIHEYVRLMLEGIDQLSPWEKRLRVRTVADMHLPLPMELHPFRDYYVTLPVKTDPVDGRRLDAYRLTMFDRHDSSRRAKNTDQIHVVREARLLLRDDKRQVAGYTVRPNDLIVVPMPGREPFEARREVLAKLAAAGLTGIPLLPLSAEPWTKPEAEDSLPRDYAKAKASCFLFERKRHVARRPSEGWTPTARVPTDADVYVVLEGYRPLNQHGGSGEDWVAQYSQDESMLARYQLAMPPIIGYKTTERNPVRRDKLKGQEYGEWRKGPMWRLILGRPGMMELVQSYAWSQLSDGWRSLDAGWLGRKLGPDHLLARIAAEARASESFNRESGWIRDDIRHLYNGLYLANSPLEADVARATVKERYPLFRSTQLQALCGSERDHWLEYVRLIDEREERRLAQEDERAA